METKARRKDMAVWRDGSNAMVPHFAGLPLLKPVLQTSVELCGRGGKVDAADLIKIECLLGN